MSWLNAWHESQLRRGGEGDRAQCLSPRLLEAACSDGNPSCARQRDSLEYGQCTTIRIYPAHVWATTPRYGQRTTPPGMGSDRDCLRRFRWQASFAHQTVIHCSQKETKWSMQRNVVMFFWVHILIWIPADLLCFNLVSSSGKDIFKEGPDCRGTPQEKHWPACKWWRSASSKWCHVVLVLVLVGLVPPGMEVAWVGGGLCEKAGYREQLVKCGKSGRADR